MPDDNFGALAPEERILHPLPLRARVTQEVARVRRSGGFLSIGLMGRDSTSSVDGGYSSGLTRAAERVRTSMRTQDVIGWFAPATLALIMPDTDMAQGLRAAERLAAIANQAVRLGWSSPPPVPRLSIGIATGYGEVEGGGDALLEAAEQALREAPEGGIKGSDFLKGHPRILVIDDDAAFARALAETVTEMGWEGEPCSDPFDGPERVRQRAYSALFVDLMMPGRSGVEILRESLMRYPRRPAVIMSGQDASHEAILEALSLGPVMFVQKPIAPADLESALQMFRTLLPGVQKRR